MSCEKRSAISIIPLKFKELKCRQRPLSYSPLLGTFRFLEFVVA